MKFIYQQMLAFLSIIIILSGTLAMVFFHLTKEMTYENVWQQMQGYAYTLRKEALKLTTDKAGKTIIVLNVSQLKATEKLLSAQNTHFTIYTSRTDVLYPDNSVIRENRSISKADWKKLTAGNVVKRKQDFRPRKSKSEVDGSDVKITDIYAPCFDYQGNLVAVIKVGEDLSNITQNLQIIRRNVVLTVAFAILVGVILSIIIAHFLTKKIARLRNATDLVAAGNFDVHLDTNGDSELDKLTLDFNSMVQSLRESNEEIKRQEERRRQFFADAAHEMRTPLTTINGLLEGLAYDAIPEESKEKSIELMRNETKRLIRLVNENLDYEKIRSGQIELSKTEFDVVQVLNNIIKQLRNKAEQVGDKFELYTPDKLMVYADYDRLVQIIFNITQNAIQFTENGVISISAEKGNEETIIRISDNGIGMNEEQLRNIWERYYKADPSRKNTKYGESGLGLSIVHQLMQLHQGSVTVESKEGKGTTFTLRFPNKNKLSKI
ncbi:sensor histidine kinase [Ligilactobacillus salivarius]|uniref:sensor histidine kinase n=1 Tax=Ligilactobacillus salivarius TaxID=1624 RepID=UPI0009D984E5|nr:HAMP domain-containing sensor histidine kinase [Ligilactobacillus salivarius]OQR02033.1 two-component sensor histidine kinase [Ligilactobacillus salivarius]